MSWVRQNRTVAGFDGGNAFNSEDVLILYKNPQLLWFSGIPIIYWVTRIWFLAQRGKISDDPVVFAMKDRISYYLLAALFLIILVAKY